MFTSPIGDESYNKYYQLPRLSYNCIEYLMENNELVWKLLKYNTPDAWTKTDLSRVEKAELIYAGQEDATNSRIFLNPGQPDVWSKEVTILRISPYSIRPENRTVGNVMVSLEIFSHNKIDHLSNYETRVMRICQQLLEVFNGTYVGGIGRLFFDRLGNFDDKMQPSGQLPFKGAWILMSTKMG